METRKIQTGSMVPARRNGASRRLSPRFVLERPTNKVCILHTVEEVLTHWEFFLQGLEVLNDPNGARGDMSPGKFFQMLIHVATAPDDHGFVLLMTSSNDKPLGFCTVMDGTDIFHDKRIALGQLMWSSKKSPGLGRDMIIHMLKICKKLGWDELQCDTRRNTGAAKRLFEKVLGFQFCHTAYKIVL